MTQHSMGDDKRIGRNKPLHPKLLGFTNKDDDAVAARMKLTRVKHGRHLKVTGTDTNVVSQSLLNKDAAHSKETYLKVVETDFRPEPKPEFDIYFMKEYAGVNELIEHGVANFMEIHSENGHITHSSIKREIETELEGVKYYDLVSPYGYGGPVIHSYTDLPKVVEEFNEQFTEYCLKNRIVSEFVRFHPIFRNQSAFREIYDITYLRNTVGTDFKRFEDTFQNEFSRTARTRVRKHLRDDRFSFTVARGFNNIEDFIDIYNATMERHNATDFYYFDEKYFYTLKDTFGKDILTSSVKFEDEVIAMGLYFLSGNIIHDHLNGTKPEYLKYSPAYLLKYASMMWGVEHGYALIHYGGGVSNAEDDPVLHFKKRFSRHTEFQFYIGKKVWNPEVYNRLCQKTGVGKDSEFFPAYRA